MLCLEQFFHLKSFWLFNSSFTAIVQQMLRTWMTPRESENWNYYTVPQKRKWRWPTKFQANFVASNYCESLWADYIWSNSKLPNCFWNSLRFTIWLRARVEHSWCHCNLNRRNKVKSPQKQQKKQMYFSRLKESVCYCRSQHPTAKVLVMVYVVLYTTFYNHICAKKCNIH